MLAATALLASAAAGYSFLAVGDWGGAALEGDSAYAKTTVAKVASAMSAAAAQSDARFIINTGDNFYWCGIQNTSDFQVQADWLGPFQSEKSLQVPWYSVLGNHEYGYNVDAQIELGKKYPNWVLDARYYTRRVQLSGADYATFIALDSSPCVQQYRATSSSGWDPCGSAYPTCSLSSDKQDQFEGKCEFHSNIMSQDCGAQYTWLEQQLAKVPKGDWLIVSGHHPVDEIDEQDFTSLLQKHGFDLYINGHTHTLARYSIDDGGAYVTSGGGSLVQTADQEDDHAVVKLAGGNLTAASGHSYKTVWNQKTAGFTRHTFDSAFATLTNEFVSYEGKVLYSFSVKKGAGPAPGPTPPTPPVPPTPTGSCAVYHCGSPYNKTHTCQCNANCVFHHDCCGDYQKLCG
eukprot:TRINITY_DN23226_c1_g1_i1.p1 TRINITY_DN23226_c1_g1~~TRINITY_DN23226_c1_g1_i1.p1  ORF type:complete len:431 (+),score=174.57 TRINITY_DN23226_c1_g1_i1:85-1293(+)